MATSRLHKDRTVKDKAEDVIGAVATVKVFTKLPGADEKEKVKQIAVEQFITEPAHIRVNAGVTKNQGNYESLRIDVAITYPCYKEQVAEVFPRIAEMVADYLDAELENYGMGDK